MEHVKNTNPRLTNTYTKRGRQRFTRFDKMPTSPGVEERDLLMIHTRYKRLQLVLLRTLTKNQPILKMGYILYL